MANVVKAVLQLNAAVCNNSTSHWLGGSFVLGVSGSLCVSHEGVSFPKWSPRKSKMDLIHVLSLHWCQVNDSLLDLWRWLGPAVLWHRWSFRPVSCMLRKKRLIWRFVRAGVNGLMVLGTSGAKGPRLEATIILPLLQSTTSISTHTRPTCKHQSTLRIHVIIHSVLDATGAKIGKAHFQTRIVNISAGLTFRPLFVLILWLSSERAMEIPLSRKPSRKTITHRWWGWSDPSCD